ncbi:hypothetical protein M514_19276 [Trichuris suis]|uniref:Uncharacterized protein n=1 Tax=Trichuris suis TaxID=68888 RepID=A0A085NG54_9BILA|nr:hypothetical protein M514_19276 [Trichuris suis]
MFLLFPSPCRPFDRHCRRDWYRGTCPPGRVGCMQRTWHRRHRCQRASNASPLQYVFDGMPAARHRGALWPHRRFTRQRDAAVCVPSSLCAHVLDLGVYSVPATPSADGQSHD